jgi:hypothetical protein
VTLSLAGLLIGVIGLFPIGREVYGWLVQRMPIRRMLPLGRRTRLDVVVTTNETQKQEPGVADAYLTAVGEVRGVAAVSRVLSRIYPRKPLNVHISEEYPGNPEGDILLLGGPRRNRWTRHFIDRFNREFDAGLVIDAENCHIRIGNFHIKDFDLRHVAGVPSQDIGLVIITAWGAGLTQRAIMCGGLTTYGTEAAARFIFADLHHDPALRRDIVGRLEQADAIVIAVHALIEARVVQQTSVYSSQGRKVIWTGLRRSEP